MSFARVAIAVLLLGSPLLAPRAFGQPAAELSPLLTEPKTPAEALKATLLMVDVGRPKLARRYLTQMLSMMPDDAALLDLREQYGADAFLKLSNVRELQPQSVQLLERVNAAFRRRAGEPARIDRLIGNLGGTPGEQAAAILSLREGGVNVVPRLLQAVGDPRVAGNSDAIVLAIANIGAEAIPPLVAALESTDTAQRNVAIEALGFVGTKEQVIDLWYPAFAEGQEPGVREAARAAIARISGLRAGRTDAVSSDGVVRELYERALASFVPPAPTADSRTPVETWSWLPAEDLVGRVSVDPVVIALHDASRFSWQAVSLAPENEQAQALHLAARTGLALARNGWGNGLPTGPGTAYDLAVSSGPGPATAALRTALEYDNALAALATLNVLSAVGRAQDLDHEESPILAALDAADVRVQFAAANTILTLDPRRPFRESRRVVQILTRAITDDGRGRVAVVDANVSRGRTMAGLFAQLGFAAESVRTGREGFLLAANRGDLELVVLQANVIRWGLVQTIANLRADARTKSLPIVVYRDPRFPTNAVESIRARYAPVEFVDYTILEENVLDQVRPFVAAVQSPITPAQRVAQRDAALYWLARIADGQRTDVYDLSPAEDALSALAPDPDLAREAILALASIPRGTAQVELQDLAVNVANDDEVRRWAAVQLSVHVQRFGLLLSKSEATAVLDAWRSATEPSIAAALASVVGTLKPSPQRVTERLLDAPPPLLVPSSAP